MRYLKGYMMRFALSFVAMLMLASTAFGAAITVDMVAEPATTTMPDGEVIQMWGFRDTTDGSHAAGDWKIPTISAIEGDSLTINLANNVQVSGSGLVAGVSIIIPGQQATEAGAMVPEFFTDGDGDQRVNSFTHSTAYTATTTPTNSYVWGTLRAGTYLIQSGTHPAVQMQMGLYAILKVDAAVGEAYTGVLYDNEVTLLYSEIDPLVHEAVYAGVYGDPMAVVPSTGQPMTSTMEYSPAYFLINGQPYVPGDAPYAAGATGNRVLLRFLNAGLQNRVPVVQGSYMTILAEDGYRKAFDLQRYSVFLSPGKTFDAYIPSLPAGPLPLYDRRLSFENSSGAGNGMLAYLNSAPTVPLTLIHPNGGENIVVGDTLNVRWSPIAGAARYRLFYFDAVGTPHLLADNNSAATSFDWTISTDVLAEAGKRMRITVVDGGDNVIGVDWTDETFSISPASITVLAPNGGEVLTAGSTVTVQWEVQSGAARYRLFYFDADGTAHFIRNVNGGNTTSYNWTIPLGIVSEAGKRFRITALDAANANIGVDWSDGTFTVNPGPGTLTAPNGGEVYSKAGPAVTVEWLVNPSAAKYRLFYFDANGDPHLITDVNDGNATSYSWTIPVGAVEEAGKLFRISGLDGTNTPVSVDWSDGTFEITP